MPAPIAVIATAGFVAYLALWPALAGWVVVRAHAPPTSARACVAAAAAWTLAEWLRGYVFTRLPVARRRLRARSCPAARCRSRATRRSAACSWCRSRVALCAAAIAGIMVGARAGARAPRRRMPRGIAALLVGAGARAARVEWTRGAGAPLAVSLVQGNVVAGAEVRSRVSRRATSSSTSDLVRASQGAPRRAAGERVSAVRRRDSGATCSQRLAGTRRARATATSCSASSRRAAAGPGEDERIYNSVREPGRRAAAAVSQAPPRSVRRIDSAEAARRLVHQPRAAHSAGRPGRRAGATSRRSTWPASASRSTSATRTSSARSSSPPARGATLLVNVTNDAWYGRSIARAPAQPDRGDARARDRPADAARHQHRHHVGDRARRPRARRAAVVRAGHPRSRDRGTHGRHALPALRRLCPCSCSPAPCCSPLAAAAALSPHAPRGAFGAETGKIRDFQEVTRRARRRAARCSPFSKSS